MTIDPKLKNDISAIALKHINPNETKVFIFGSRVSGTNVKFSDIDLGFESDKKIPYNLIMDIEDDFENSNIPYSVDVVDFSKVSNKFKEVAMKNIMYLN
ncbi:MAG: polymerase beta domain protein region protein [Candidatus Collierbacteria bacterium GW2011_GWB1_45_35]|uniref:Polymerase beta domain protein region protein n=2 Tax=Candidatus Collieribacteriota TaxID=1752725 RepID=A0A0G1KQJ0_9BACT|nr:MAG: polymerase beta subunit protein [Microgenomates group bacterium GW2011_GWC1_44_23]KKT85740.1 MAG: polymerase beta domain protein region protein [Candidatus Collierbacteria bacterium GW2011_GWA2_44_99]KKT94725.1 MAG: polymerase beta domain protein region protein [Candidatus Collierbacteria bacterium GW2011_GWA1_45_15]KKT98980.1 MAG: polymerase beta domain protein region protein [Candidatus Collierbacteria bacterium GW2011_GWB2_45_17]KKU04594.1 MAG: polymerase beta domain protein region p